MRYYRVICKQGHHGNGKYQPIVFAIAAQNVIEAMDRAKEMPSVKHSSPVVQCTEITLAEYKRLRQVSAYKRMEERLWL